MPVSMNDEWSKGIRKWSSDRAEWLAARPPARRFRITYSDARLLRRKLLHGDVDKFPRHTKLSDIVTELQEVWKEVRLHYLRASRRLAGIYVPLLTPAQDTSVSIKSWHYLPSSS